MSLANVPKGAGLQIRDFVLIDGVNAQDPPHVIQDTQATVMQDILLDRPGFLRRRGPVKIRTSAPTFSYGAVGMVGTYDVAGTYRVMVLNGSSSAGKYSVLPITLDSKTDIRDLYDFPPSTEGLLFSASQCINGGALIGTSDDIDIASTGGMTLAYWKGANKATNSTGTITATRGSTAVSGSSTTFTSDVVPGMFLFAEGDDPVAACLLGTVKSVTDNTNLVLEVGSLVAATAKTPTFVSIRGVRPNRGEGLATTTTTSATMTGSKTKWKRNSTGMDAIGSSHVAYRKSDMAFIGKVSTVESDGSLTLAANAAVALDLEEYILINPAIKSESPVMQDLNGFGFISTAYAGRQWYANRGVYRRGHSLADRVYFSSLDDFETIFGHDNEGDFIDFSGVGATGITGLGATKRALLVFKLGAVYAVTGDSPSTFAVQQIHDDGALSPQSVQSYDDGVLWAGQQGMYYFNGTAVEILTDETLGDFYRRAMLGYDPDVNRVRSMVHKQHYFVYLADIDSPITMRKTTSNGPPPVVTSTTPTKWTIVQNLHTGAISFFSNLYLKSSMVAPPDTGLGTLYLVNDSSNIAKLCSADDLFGDSSADVFACEDATVGPDLYIESKKFDMGIAEQKKLWKQLAMTFRLTGAALKFEVVTGLNDTGVLSTSTWATNTEYKNKRIKFLKRSTHLQFRIWQASASVAIAILGPMQLGFKWQRKGRVG